MYNSTGFFTTLLPIVESGAVQHAGRRSSRLVKAGGRTLVTVLFPRGGKVTCLPVKRGIASMATFTI